MEQFLQSTGRRSSEGSVVMDVGITSSDKSHPIHWITGMFVVTVGFSAAMFAVRVVVIGV